MKYEWDEGKNQKNFAKHGLKFEDADTVFSGPCVTFNDDRFCLWRRTAGHVGLAGWAARSHSACATR